MKELEQLDKLFVGVKEIVNSGLCSRNTLFDIMREDPKFPKGKKVGGESNSPTKWYLPDIIDWVRGNE
jgi:predicted DNA-binding transcriptional regulator AlpA